MKKTIAFVFFALFCITSLCSFSYSTKNLFNNTSGVYLNSSDSKVGTINAVFVGSISGEFEAKLDLVYDGKNDYVCKNFNTDITRMYIRNNPDYRKVNGVKGRYTHYAQYGYNGVYYFNYSRGKNNY